MDNLPYKASQSEMTQALCRGCRGHIRKGQLRIAAMIQSFKKDAKEEHWFHFPCFFQSHRPKSIDQIAYFENLHPDNQKKIREKVADANVALLPQPGPSNSQKKNATKRKADNGRLKDFGVEYAKSGRAACAGCGDKIIKDEVRVFYTSYATEVGKRYGGQNFSHHPACFVEIRDRYNFFLNGSELPGFNNLSKKDQVMIEEVIPALQMTGSQAKKMRKEPKTSRQRRIKANSKSLFMSKRSNI